MRIPIRTFRYALLVSVFIATVTDLTTLAMRQAAPTTQTTPAQQADAKAVQLEKECNSGTPASCDKLGELYRAGREVPQDHKRAVELYRRSCDAGHPHGCYSLGMMHIEGKGVGKDVTQGVKLLQQSCDASELQACNDLGLYLLNTGKTKQGIELLQRACDAGTPTGSAACGNLGLVYAMGGRGVHRDESRAAALWERACDGQELQRCTDLGSLYQEGKGVKKDTTRAAALYERACDAQDHVACYRVGIMYSNGDGVPPHKERAAQLYMRGCDNGSVHSCLAVIELKFMNGDTVDNKKAAPFYARACEGGREKEDTLLDRQGRALSCLLLGRLYQKGTDVEKDDKRGAALIARACSLGLKGKVCETQKTR